MKLSWTSIKISIAGARLSHLVQHDRIWDHGSMVEQAKAIFYLLQKAKATGNLDVVKRQCSVCCYEKLKTGENIGAPYALSSVVKEVAIIGVRPGRNRQSDRFCALIKSVSNERPEKEFKTQYLFVRQGEWWVLDELNW